MTRRRIVIKTRDTAALRENFNSAARREEGAASPPTQKRPTRTRIGLYRRSMKETAKQGILRLRLVRRFVGMLPRAGILLCLARKERGDGTVHRSPHFAARSRPPLAFPRPARSAQQKMSGQKSAQFIDGDLAGNRTRDCAVRGRRLNRLTTRPYELVLRSEPPRRANFPLKPRLLGDYSIFSPILQPFLRMVEQNFFPK